MTLLNEKALRPDTLRDLVHPIISLDEYTPKLDESNIVVMFQVLDNFDAAYDLSSFIERSPENVLDTEAVETPNLDGRYPVYVEMERNGEFPAKLMRLLKDIANIAPSVQWKLQIYEINDPVDVDPEAIQNSMHLPASTEVLEFFQHSYTSVLNEGDVIEFTSLGNDKLYFKNKGLISEQQVKEALQHGSAADDTNLEKFLGEENYTVLKIAESDYLVGRSDGKYVLLGK